jgi:hypothetical protein
VTNLFFVKALQHWPNVLAVGRKEAAGGHWGAAAPGGGAASLLNPSTAVRALKRRQQGALQLMAEHTQVRAWWGAEGAVGCGCGGRCGTCRRPELQQRSGACAGAGRGQG